ncbi:MAG: glutamate racemase [Bacteroidia bacterium]
MSDNKQPIGIFDSGIGGLTVANAINQLLPEESLIYFGDTAHLPYGDKSPHAIELYSKAISDFLLEKQCKMIVIACNTASSIAFEAVQKHVGNKVVVVNVIDPVVEAVINQVKKGKIGVIGTKATIKNGAYERRIKELSGTLEVGSLATPLLAPMIEEGFFNNKISRTIINSYLSRPKLKNIDAIILACTHYPLIKEEIIEYYTNELLVVDSAQIVAEHVKKILTKKKLTNTKRKFPHHFYVSDYTKSFEKSTRIFFKGRLKLEYQPLWEK